MKSWPKFMQRRIYADAAASTPLTPNAKRELIRLLDLYGNPGGLHKEGMEAKEELEHARKMIAEAIGAHADEIIFTASGTEANNLAIQGILRPLLEEYGELHAITTSIEHPSVLEPLVALEREGLYTTQMPVEKTGGLVPKNLREIVTEQTALVSVQMVNSEIGTVQDIREIAKEVRHVRSRRDPSARALRAARPSLTLALGSAAPSLPIYFHCDASQAPLWLPLHVEKLGVDLLTLDAQKVGGPKGVGVLYIRRGTNIEPILFGGGQESGVRSSTENLPLVGSFAVALRDAQKSYEQNAAHVAGVRDYLFAEIKKNIPDIQLNGAELSARIANNLNISIPKLDAQMAVIALDANGVAASMRSACDSDNEAPSHVLSAIGLSPQEAKNSLRLTLLPDVTKNDAKRIADALMKVTVGYRSHLL